MRLPSGRLVRSMKGGQWVLRDLLIELEEEKFNGFIRTNLRKGMKYGEGAIVLKDGVPVLASYSYEDEISGPECLGHLVEDVMDPGCGIELRSFSYRSSTIRIDGLLKIFSSAMIEPGDFNIRRMTETLQRGATRAAPAKTRRVQVDEGARKVDPKAVKTMTGRFGLICFSLAKSSIPPMRGILTSVMTRSGFSSSTISMAFLPESAASAE